MNSPQLLAKVEMERRSRWKAKRSTADATALRELFGIDLNVHTFTDAEKKAYLAEARERIDWSDAEKLSYDEIIEQMLRGFQSSYRRHVVSFKGRRVRLGSLSLDELKELVNENGDFLRRPRRRFWET